MTSARSSSTAQPMTTATRPTWVVGTAGHVDHGKSTLVRALTGTDPDRLREEKEREMTIDLGFAWLELADGVSVSVVDVPGHERFIKNMLAGVGGIDAAMLVIAADEGPMPQTAEHLAILDLLEIDRGIVVLTKRDLVDDEWLELVIEETRDRLSGTVLANAPIIAVSSTSRAGLDVLVRELTAMLATLPARADIGKPRLPIDRSFTVAGFGTVVTGTLLGGSLEVGQEVEILPDGHRARVRGIQSHGRKTDQGLPGARTAINLAGIERDAIARGDVLTTPGWLEPTTIIDVRLRLTDDAPEPLEQNDLIDLFIGATETLGNVTLLDAERLLPGEEGWVQIRLSQSIAAVAGDRFIVRRPSPSLTIGGGRVIDPHPRRHRRFRQDVIQALETRATGTPAERLLAALASGPVELRAIAERLEIDLASTRAVVDESIASGESVVLGLTSGAPIEPNRLVALAGWVERNGAALVALLTEFHERHPLRRGMAREEVKSRINLSGRPADTLIQTLVSRGVVADLGSLLALPSHQIVLTATQQAAADRFVAALAANPNSPPAADGFGISSDLLAAMADLGQIVRLPDNIVFGAAQLAEIQAETLRLIDEQASLTLAQFRDHFGSSRKYAQAVLEYFDQQRITRRAGDARVRGSA